MANERARYRQIEHTADLGVEVCPENATTLTQLGMEIKRAVDREIDVDLVAIGSGSVDPGQDGAGLVGIGFLRRAMEPKAARAPKYVIWGEGTASVDNPWCALGTRQSEPVFPSGSNKSSNRLIAIAAIRPMRTRSLESRLRRSMRWLPCLAKRARGRVRRVVSRHSSIRLRRFGV